MWYNRLNRFYRWPYSESNFATFQQVTLSTAVSFLQELAKINSHYLPVWMQSQYDLYVCILHHIWSVESTFPSTQLCFCQFLHFGGMFSQFRWCILAKLLLDWFSWWSFNEWSLFTKGSKYFHLLEGKWAANERWLFETIMILETERFWWQIIFCRTWDSLVGLLTYRIQQYYSPVCLYCIDHLLPKEFSLLQVRNCCTYTCKIYTMS